MTGGYDNADPEKDLTFAQGDQPATIPRVSELYIIAKISPWVATVTASQPKRGVTLGDVINCVWSTSVSFILLFFFPVIPIFHSFLSLLPHPSPIIFLMAESLSDSTF
jgi:hypothetical protein